MQTAAVRHRGIHERLAQVDAPAGGVQHPLDEVAHRRIAQRERDALGDTGAGDEDAVGGVDPQLLDGRVVEIGLERSEEHTSELQSLMRISYAVFCLKKK